MSAHVTWDGLAEYQEQLRQLPEACLGEAVKLIEGETNAAYVRIATVYAQHRFTGTLLRLLKLVPISSGGRLTGGRTLRSGSPLAWLFDNGSQARHWKSGKSTGEMWGTTSNPPTHTFSGTVGRARRRLATQFHDLLLRHGATRVISDAG